MKNDIYNCMHVKSDSRVGDTEIKRQSNTMSGFWNTSILYFVSFKIKHNNRLFF